MNEITTVLLPGKIYNEKGLIESLRSRAGRVGKQPAGRRLTAEQFERELMLLKMTPEDFDAYVEKLKSERGLK